MKSFRRLGTVGAIVLVLALILLPLVLRVREEISLQRRRAFVLAAWEGDITKMKSLLKWGADVNWSGPGGGTAGTALGAAARNGRNDVVQFLLDRGANTEVKGKFDTTPLLWTAREGHTETARLLLAKGADANARETFDGYTVLMHAIRGGHIEVVKLLLQNGADVHARSTYEPHVSALDMVGETGEMAALLKQAAAKK